MALPLGFFNGPILAHQMPLAGAVHHITELSRAVRKIAPQRLKEAVNRRAIGQRVSNNSDLQVIERRKPFIAADYQERVRDAAQSQRGDAKSGLNNCHHPSRLGLE
jgi:hypothetical protein